MIKRSGALKGRLDANDLCLHALKRNRKSDDVDFLGAFSADSSGELDILRHDGHALGVDGAKVGVFKQSDEIRLGRLLQGADGGRLEPEIRLEVLSDLADETLEGQLADQQLRRLLVAANFTERHRSGAVTMGLLDTAGGRRALPRSLGGELLARRFASRGLTGGLLRASHFFL